MEKQARLYRKDLRQWLESKNPEDFVGNPRSSESCPLNRFLSETVPNVVAVSVIPGRVFFKTRDEEGRQLVHVSHSSWARRFVRKVDRNITALRAKHCLGILDEMEK